MSTTSTTYYLLRTKTSAQGDGAYLGADLGVDANASAALVASATAARRFASLADAEQASQEIGPTFGGFELEVRNSAD